MAHAHELVYSDFPRGSRVLDVGFGDGQQMLDAVANGCSAVGIDPDPTSVERARARGLEVHTATAESLPFPDRSVDGVVCKVVVPYTDEARAIGEWARVLRPGGLARVTYHGSGYYLQYLLAGENWKYRVYGARSLANTWVYRATGRRLPGFLGDTIYQSEQRLDRYYRTVGFELLEREIIGSYGGKPVFIHHHLRRTADAG